MGHRPPAGVCAKELQRTFWTSRVKVRARAYKQAVWSDLYGRIPRDETVVLAGGSTLGPLPGTTVLFPPSAASAFSTAEAFGQPSAPPGSTFTVTMPAYSTSGQLVAEGATNIGVTWSADVTGAGVFENPNIERFEVIETAWEPTLIATG